MAFIVFSTHASEKFINASSYDLEEKSIVNISHFTFSSSIAKFIVLKPLAVQISSILVVLVILIKSTKNFVFTSLIFGIVLSIQYCLNFFKNNFLSTITLLEILFIIYLFFIKKQFFLK
ncbi:hypothetical protein HOG21_05755 [bacterium]|jgi:hypothetical protein|nr:hypothetical protein [bacterium]